MNCEWVKSQISLYLYHELDDPERVELEQHVDHCPACAARLERERRLLSVMDQRPKLTVDPNLLAECRIRLSEELENIPRHRFPWARFVSVFHGLRLSFQPSLMALLLVLGFGAGWGLSSWRGNIPVLPGSSGTASDLNLANISTIQSITPDPQGNLEIVFDTTRRRVVRGNAKDPQIERLLVFAANNYSSPGIRLDSIEQLKDRAEDQDVRKSLITALRSDQNAGVRLKALEALRDFSADQQVKGALLEALRKDDNPGVRIEAIEQLGKLRDASTVPLLQQLASGDPNNYVRMRSASALRDLNAAPEIY